MLSNLILLEIISLLFIRNIKILMIISISYLYFIFFLLLSFNSNLPELQFRSEFLSYSLGLDGINITLLGLLGILEPILILLSQISFNSTLKKSRSGIKIFNLSLVTIKSLKFFISLLFLFQDFFVFFLSFEFVLVPIFLFISSSGSSYQYFLPRLEAALRLYSYTIFGSLFMLIALIISFLLLGTSNNDLLLFKLSLDDSSFKPFLWLLLFLSFMVKLPMFPFHNWLPFAHSDAPTIGSILLAAILLKLASFGILRYSLFIWTPSPLWFDSSPIYSYFLPFVFVLAFLSILYSSFVPLSSLFDFKKIIAYSSIVHMNYSIFGFFSNSLIGLLGSSLLIFSHAFISSSFFLLIGILYSRYHSRNLSYFSGLFISMPIFSFFFLLFSFANLSIPFNLSFISEFFIFSGTYLFNPLFTLILLISLLLSSSFIIWFTNRILFGPLSPFLKSSKDLSLSEFSCLLPFLFFTIFFAFFPNSLLSLFEFHLLLLL